MTRLSLPAIWLGIFTCLAGVVVGADLSSEPDTIGRLKSLTLEELMQVQVSSVSRRPEHWWTAAGAIDVLTGDDIRRSGALSLPDALRLVSGVNVTQPAARTWGIGIRGFTVPGGNKINAQLDGRTLFTPFYSGVFWDVQDTMLADVDRIEVVRGPVGAVWGAYAVNGIIEILTKPAWDTQGVLTSAAITSDNSSVGNVRYGGRVNDDTFYRVYAQYRELPSTYLNGKQAEANGDFLQSGFRVDSRRLTDATVTVQGDMYTNRNLARNGTRDIVSGANILGRWQKLYSADSDAQVMTYYDFTDRHFFSGLSERRHTVQLNGKYHVVIDRNEFQFGTDNTVSRDTIGNIPSLMFDPAKRTVHVFSAYGNYVRTFVPERFSTTIGAKVEHNSFTAFEVQPTARAIWTPTRQTTLWAAVSRAVRTPVRFDQDVVFPGIFAADDNFRSEVVWAYELGLRRRITDDIAFDLALFDNHYDRLRSYQPIGAPLIPLTFRNMLNAQSSGAELSVMFQVSDALFLTASYRYFDIDFSEDPGARNIFGTRFEANDPRHMGSLVARFDVSPKLQFDTTIRAVGSLPWLRTKGYVTADIRLGYALTKHWNISLIGRNLADKYHVESIIPQQTSGAGKEVVRSIALRVTATF